MDEALKCYFLTLEEATAFRDWYWPLLQRAIDDADGRIDPASVWDEIASSRAAVFVVTDEARNLKAAATVTVHDAQTHRWADIELCGGDDVGDWVGLGIEAIRRYAEHIGCDYLMLEGRRGWQKHLHSLGFETRRIQAVLRLH